MYTHGAMTESSISQLLSNTFLFGGLRPESAAQIESIAARRTYEKGEIIFTEGDDAHGFYITASGTVKIYKLSVEGKEQTLHIFGPGEPFGEVPVFTGGSFPATAETLTRAELVYLPRREFVNRISANPSLALNMLAVLSHRLRAFTRQVESLSLKEVPARLADYLLYLSREAEETSEITLPIPKGQLASLLGTIPETLSRIFAKMTAEGVIRVSGRSIRLQDPPALEAMAAGEKSLL